MQTPSRAATTAASTGASPAAPPNLVRYSNTPARDIDISTLTPSRFLLQRERQLPYRDADGSVNLELVRQSLETARELPNVDETIVAKLEKWERHAERAITTGNLPSPYRPSRHASPVSTARLQSSSRQPQLTRRLTMAAAEDGAAPDEELPLSLRKPSRSRGENEAAGAEAAGSSPTKSPSKRPRLDAGSRRGSPMRSPMRPTAQARAGSSHASPLRSTPPRRDSHLSPIVTYALADRELHPRQSDPYVPPALIKDDSSGSGGGSGSEDVFEVRRVRVRVRDGGREGRA